MTNLPRTIESKIIYYRFLDDIIYRQKNQYSLLSKWYFEFFSKHGSTIKLRDVYLGRSRLSFEDLNQHFLNDFCIIKTIKHIVLDLDDICKFMVDKKLGVKLQESLSKITIMNKWTTTLDKDQLSSYFKDFQNLDTFEIIEPTYFRRRDTVVENFMLSSYFDMFLVIKPQITTIKLNISSSDAEFLFSVSPNSNQQLLYENFKNLKHLSVKTTYCLKNFFPTIENTSIKSLSLKCKFNDFNSENINKFKSLEKLSITSSDLESTSNDKIYFSTLKTLYLSMVCGEYDGISLEDNYKFNIDSSSPNLKNLYVDGSNAQSEKSLVDFIRDSPILENLAFEMKNKDAIQILNNNQTLNTVELYQFPKSLMTNSFFKDMSTSNIKTIKLQDIFIDNSSIKTLFENSNFEYCDRIGSTSIITAKK